MDGRQIGTALALTAVFAAGATAGWSLRDRTADRRPPPLVVTVDRPVVAVDDGADVTVAAPNVLGLREEEARQVLVDAGADPASTRFVKAPSAGEPGLIVIQDPPAGVPAPDGFTLSVSDPAITPELVGKPIDETRDALDALGARVRVTSRYDPAQPEGTVLEMTPPPGAPLSPEVAIVVSAAPSSAFLSTLDPIESNCSRGTDSVNGTDYQQSLRCPAQDAGRARPVVYLINRLASRLEAVIGQSATSDPGSAVHFAVRGDDRVLAEGTARYGEALPITADLTGILRLSIEATIIDRPDDVDRPTLVFGSATVIGGPDEIDQLTAGG